MPKRPVSICTAVLLLPGFQCAIIISSKKYITG